MATQLAVDTSPPRRGDRDAGGDDRVARLQDRLKLLELLDTEPDGAFGAGTELAIRRFQWFLTNASWRLRVPAGGTVTTALVEPFPRNPAVTISGAWDLATALEAKVWAENGYRPTGLLVRRSVAGHANLEQASSMRQLNGVARGEVLVDEGFLPGIGVLDAAAGTAGVVFRVNQAFRVQGAVVGGAVVTPATRSQHLIGRALDGNAVENGTVRLSAEMGRAGRGTPFARMVEEAVRGGLRWGGNFAPTDPVHFDAEVPARSEEYDMRFFFSQRAYRDRHPVRAA